MKSTCRNVVHNATGLVKLEINTDVATIVFQNALRHNCLTTDFLQQFLTCLQTAKNTSELRAIIIKAEGRSFSTGGDLRAFYEHYDTIEAYSHKIVGLLNQTIMEMLQSDTPIISRVHGPATGGSFGFILASDLVVMADNAFFAPYYVDVGFAPDGGWTAILPERIGEHRAKSVQLLNTHIKADLALSWGLVDHVDSVDALDQHIDHWLNILRSKVTHETSFTKRNILDKSRLKHYQEKLEQERRFFIEAIIKPETKQGIAQFLEALKTSQNTSTGTH